MALDDSVKARAINVTTHGTTVTLSGTVDSNAERDRAMALARETDGVTKSSTICTRGEDSRFDATSLGWRPFCIEVASEWLWS